MARQVQGTGAITVHGAVHGFAFFSGPSYGMHMAEADDPIIARIVAALARVEAAMPPAPTGLAAQAIGDHASLATAHAALRAAVSGAIAEIDTLIADTGHEAGQLPTALHADAGAGLP